ncbi:MAG TPA: ABC transporter permease [Acidimicrobiia bacterium]|nr:ABC transporter permease [Acidimicrobiia bacterium]
MTATVVDALAPVATTIDGRVPPWHGFGTLWLRRLQVTTKTASGIIGQLMTPVLWILVVGPALADSLGSFSPGVDYYTFIAVGQVAFLIPFTAMFSGINVIVDKEFGVTREMLVAPVRRAAIPLANAVAVLTVTFVQVAIIVGLGRLRGAHFHTSLFRLPWFLIATALLCLTMYGVAETLALRIGRQEAFGPLIPAIGVTPYFLSGALYPLSVLPDGIQQVGFLLPWTHAVALMRYGLMDGTNPRLDDIWHLGSDPLMAVLSAAVLAAYAALMLTIAVRTFKRTTLA